MPSAFEPVWSQKCVRIKKDGERCKKWAVKGGTCCASHNNAPQVRRKAAQRMEEARDALVDLVAPAVARLAELIRSGNDPVVLKACTEILDRAGLVIVQKSAVEITEADPEAVRRRATGLLDELAARRVSSA